MIGGPGIGRYGDGIPRVGGYRGRGGEGVVTAQRWV